MISLSDIETHYENLKVKFKDFTHKIKQECVETQAAWYLLHTSVSEHKPLTDEEKHEIGEQLKDVLKTVGLVGIAALPGGSLFFVLSTYLKINKYVLPSSFNESGENNAK